MLLFHQNLCIRQFIDSVSVAMCNVVSNVGLLSVVTYTFYLITEFDSFLHSNLITSASIVFKDIFFSNSYLYWRREVREKHVLCSVESTHL